MSAVLFGSISTIADTSELQREAFNEAFRAHGLDWTWDRKDYQAMLDTSGGQNRIEQYARSLGQEVDARAIHETKSEIFRANLERASITPRPGVIDTIKAAKENGYKVGFVTTTSAENVASLLSAVSAQIDAGDFDLVVDASSAGEVKPDPAAYAFALQTLGLEPQDCVAVEDNVEGLAAAVAAGLACVATPNDNTAGHDFGSAHEVTQHLSFEGLRSAVGTE